MIRLAPIRKDSKGFERIRSDSSGFEWIRQGSVLLKSESFQILPKVTLNYFNQQNPPENYFNLHNPIESF